MSRWVNRYSLLLFFNIIWHRVSATVFIQRHVNRPGWKPAFPFAGDQKTCLQFELAQHTGPILPGLCTRCQWGELSVFWATFHWNGALVGTGQLSCFPAASTQLLCKLTNTPPCSAFCHLCHKAQHKALNTNPRTWSKKLSTTFSRDFWQLFANPHLYCHTS